MRDRHVHSKAFGAFSHGGIGDGHRINTLLITLPGHFKSDRFVMEQDRNNGRFAFADIKAFLAKPVREVTDVRTQLPMALRPFLFDDFDAGDGGRRGGGR